MIYMLTRHVQRYEYISLTGRLKDKTVMDIGCSYGQHLITLCRDAKEVIGVDPLLANQKNADMVVMLPLGKTREELEGMVTKIPANIFDVFLDGDKVDVVTAIEVFEHVDAPKFIDKIATLCDYAFLTTPLTKTTGKTRNITHVAEYSAQDFDAIVSSKFDILEKKYQYADLTIRDTGEPNGDSINPEHVVQMVWCKRKGG